MPLTDTSVRHAKNLVKNYSLKDMDGLHLFVSAKGVKRWHFRFYWLGRQTSLSRIDRIFAKDVLPLLGPLPIAEISRQHLIELLCRTESRQAFTTAEKCRTWFNHLFRYAMVEKGLMTKPSADLDIVAIPKPPVTNKPYLLMEETPPFLQKLRTYGGSATTILGLRLLFLTGVRTGELRLAVPEQFDLVRGIWTIPAVIVNTAIKRMGYERQLTGHGIRATLSTALLETSVRQSRITGNDYTPGDMDGLALHVTAYGGKAWLFRYYWVGKQKRMSLDSYPKINLKAALIEGAALICVLEGKGDVDPALRNAVGSYFSCWKRQSGRQEIERTLRSPANVSAPSRQLHGSL